MTTPIQPMDCLVIGYNELPFSEYETWLAGYGVDSEAYRDLRFSFVNVEGRKLTYVDLMNEVFARAADADGAEAPVFRSCDIPNLAAVYLTQFLRRTGLRAGFINLFQEEREVLRQQLTAGVTAVAITTTFYVSNQPVVDMVSFLREVAPEVSIIIGGPLVANHFRNASDDGALAASLSDLGADFYIHDSQGEATLAKLVAALKAKDAVEAIPNLAYFHNGELRQTPRQIENNDMDGNAIDWQDFRWSEMGPTLQTRTARSCAFSCAFCNYPTRAGKLVTSDLPTIEAELDSMKALGDVRNLVFIDDTFNVPLRRFKDICRLMIRKQYGFNWFSYFRCSNSDEEAVELMAEAGCKGVFLGIESGSPTILDAMNKHANVDKYAKGITWLKRNGILTFASFITGFPGETVKTVNETIDFIQEHEPDYYRTMLWYNEPGTPIRRKTEELGITGDGFVWEHNTMDSMEAMDHIERMFLQVDASIWLPQWSFDFWIIPYLLGRGVSIDLFRSLMGNAHQLLRHNIADLPPAQCAAAGERLLNNMVAAVRQAHADISAAIV